MSNGSAFSIYSYYIVLPITNPAAESAMLENLLPFTSYQLVIRTTNTSKLFLQTETIYFSTSGKNYKLNYIHMN